MTGSGTSEDPYIISDVDDLQAVENDTTAYYELGGDIDASITSEWNEGLGFLPLGQYGNEFTGQLDGKGYVITGLFINRTTPAGLFDYNEGTIQNVGLEDCDLTANLSAGGLAHENHGTITKCYTTGTITVGQYGRVDGLVEYNAGEGSVIQDCYSRCNLVADGTYVRAGGLVGTNDGTVDNCYSTGAVSGHWEDGFCHYNNGTVTNCFWDIETSGTETSYGGGTGKTTAEMKTEATFTDAGWDFDTIWGMRTDRNDGYAYFQWQFPEVIRIKGNPNIDQRMFQHIERMGR